MRACMRQGATVAQSADASADLITGVARRWDRIAPDLRAMLITATIQDAHAAQRTLAALFPITNGLTPDQRHALMTAVVRNPHASSALVKQIAPYWDQITESERTALLQSAARQIGAAQQALTALLPLAAEGALTHAHIHALVTTIAQSPNASATLITRSTPYWTRMDPAFREMLLRRAATRSACAIRAITALASIEGALTTDHTQMLMRFITCNPFASARLIERLGPHWVRIDAQSQQHALRAAMAISVTKAKALAALLALDGAVTEDQALAFIADASHAEIGAVITLLAPQWQRLGPVVQQRMIQRAAQDATAACHALIALLNHSAAITDAQVHALVRTIAHHPHAAGAVIERSASSWRRMDSEAQRMLLDTAARHAATARHALTALLSLPRQGKGHRTGGALTPAQTCQLARAAFPAFVWNDPLNAPTPASCDPANPRTIIALALIASALQRPIPHPPHALRSAWTALTADDHVALVHAVASDACLANGLARLVTRYTLPIADHARRRLVRAIIPAKDVLDAASTMACDAHVLMAWMPIEGIDESERATWRAALRAGVLPPHVAQWIVLHRDEPHAPGNRRFPWRARAS